MIITQWKLIIEIISVVIKVINKLWNDDKVLSSQKTGTV